MARLPEVGNDDLDAVLNANCMPSATFDVETAIQRMLRDPTCDSLELPSTLTAEQRKSAKHIVEQHPDLKCESFGMGKERRMHVFRSGTEKNIGSRTPDASPQGVNVKNTFIDDWIDASPVMDNRIVQSMPHNMFGKCLFQEVAENSLTPVDDQSLISQALSGKEAQVASSRGDQISFVEQSVDESCSPNQQAFALGATVAIHGLVKAPHFNGAVGVVQSWDADQCRYNILLASATITGNVWAKVKAENLSRCNEQD